jgi:hypothetical protein
VLEALRSKEVGKLQWLQKPSQTNAGNLKNVRHETSKTKGKKEGLSERKS